MASLRKTLLGLALVATIAATLWEVPATPDSEPVAAPARARPAVVATEAPASAPPGLRAPFTASTGNLFAVRSWLPPAPPPAKPPAPQAPALPFKYLGKMIEGNEVVAFVGQGALTHLMRKGSVVRDYKVEEVTDTEMLLVYLPLNEKQRLTFGSSN